jgi:hypothetical protein
VTIQERVEKVVREWPEWSRAERRRMDDVVEEVLTFCRSGEGNAFIREWCRRNLTPAVIGPLFTG